MKSRNAFAAIAAGTVLLTGIGFTQNTATQTKLHKLKVVMQPPKPASTKPKPYTLAQLQALDDVCNTTLKNVKALADGLKLAATQAKATDTTKITTSAALFAAVDGPVAKYYSATNSTSQDLHVSAAIATALKDANNAQTNLAAGIKVSPLVAVKLPSCTTDMNAAHVFYASFEDSEKGIRTTLANTGATLIQGELQKVIKAMDPKLLTTAITQNNAVGTSAGASLLSTSLVTWTTSSAAYDAAVKAAGASQILLAQHFQDGINWPPGTGTALTGLQTAVADKSVPAGQATLVTNELIQIEREASQMRFEAADIALKIDETSAIRAERIAGKLAAFQTLIALQNTCVESTSLPLKSISANLAFLQADILDCQTALNLITARSQSLDSRTMSQMVNLYYFTNVPEVMRALNPSSQLMSDGFFSEVDTSAQEKALRDATTAHLEAVAFEENSLLALRKAKSDLTTQQQDVAKKQAAVDQLQAQVNASNANATPSQTIAAEIAAQNTAITNLTTQRAALAAQTPPNTGQILAVDRAIARANARLTNLTQQQANIAGSETERQAQVANANSELSTSQAALTSAQTAYATAKGAYDTAVGATSTAQADEFAKSLAMGSAAIDELKAFRNQLRKQPYWVSTPNRSSTDPVQRCYIMGFENANELYVRGSAEDVRYVRELVGQFDTPSPQARITLYNLQLNSATPIAASRAVSSIQTELNGLRGNMLLIQDLLRNEIVAEVQRVERVNRSACYPTAPAFKDRIWRSFFYPLAVRNELGIGQIEIDPSDTISKTFNETYPGKYLASTVSEIDDDLNAASKQFQLALEANVDVKSFNLAASLNKRTNGRSTAQKAEEAARAKRAMYLTNSGWLSVQALNSLDSIGPTTGNLINLNDPKVKFLKNYAFNLRQEVRNNSTDDTKMQGLLNPEAGDAKVALDDMKELLVASNSLKNSFKSALTVPEGIEKISDLTVPDPIKCTTLGEMLMILSLGTLDSRTRILHNFSVDLFNSVVMAQGANSNSDLRALATSLETVFGSTAETVLKPERQDNSLFPYFPRAIFGALDPKIDFGTPSTLNSNQAEIVSALKIRGQRSCVDYVLSELKSAGLLSNGMIVDPAVKLPYMYVPLLKWAGVIMDSSTDPTPKPSGLAAQSTKPTLESQFLNFKQPQDSDNETSDRTTLRQILDHRPLASESTPRLSAANDMIKRFMSGLEADLEHFLVERSIDRIRDDANQKEIDFGSLQKQSIITTNRLVARLDTSAVATIGSQVQQDALAQAQQLATILGSGSQSQTQSSGATAGSTITDLFKAGVPVAATVLPFVRTSASEQPNLSSILSGLLLGGLSKAITDTTVPDPEIYTISSGGTFKLTPIFEPSGQALRFVFDYFNEVPIQGVPNSSATVLPRISRESIVTQVALSNLEFGQIASFESTTKAGHSSKGGGIPIVKSFFPEMPVLGYFWKSKGASVRQYSVVFAQTTMYPTISDIMRLLVESEPEPYYEIPGRKTLN